jgi:transposase InsO family protein
MIRYGRIPKDDGRLRARLEELAAERRRFGFRRLAVLIRRDGWIVNIKRVLRVYREANLQVRKRLKRRVALGPGTPAPFVSTVNERWSLDFVHDSLETGRRIRTLISSTTTRVNASPLRSTRRSQAAASRAFSMPSERFAASPKPSLWTTEPN